LEKKHTLKLASLEEYFLTSWIESEKMRKSSVFFQEDSRRRHIMIIKKYDCMMFTFPFLWFITSKDSPAIYKKGLNLHG